MATTPIKYITNDVLKTYPQKIDEYFRGYVYPRLIFAVDVDRIISHADADKVDLLITGISVYVRVMQGIDVDVEKNPDWQTNLDFFYQTTATEQGTRGSQFLDIITNGVAFGGFKGLNFSDLAKSLLKAIPVYGQSIALLESVLDSIFDFSGAKQKRAEEFADSIKNLIKLFTDFMNEFNKEFLIQNPIVVIPEDPIDPNNPKVPVNPNNPNNPTLTPTDNSNTIFIIILLVIFFVLYKKRK